MAQKPEFGLIQVVAVDPTIGAGVAGLPYQLLYRSDNGTLYIKTGNTNTAWTQVGVGSSTVERFTQYVFPATIDGNLDFDGSNVVLGDGTIIASGGGVYTLPRGIYAESIIVRSGIIINNDGFVVYANDLAGPGMIRRNGNAGASNGAAGSGLVARQLPGSTAGGTSQVTTGNNGINSTDVAWGIPTSTANNSGGGGSAGSNGTRGRGGGGGGTNTISGGGNGGQVTRTGNYSDGLISPARWFGRVANSSGQVSGSSGGGGGAGSGAVTGGGGGGGGGWVAILARRHSSANPVVVEARGGDGGNSVAGGNGASGGGGGGGGYCVYYCEEGPPPTFGPTALDGGVGGSPTGVNGRAGGNGGRGASWGYSGNNGWQFDFG